MAILVIKNLQAKNKDFGMCDRGSDVLNSKLVNYRFTSSYWRCVHLQG
ncbi:hypothetical protein H6F96_22710 [Microcoleus sp. FACHB-53]|nr:hypothetical protein [Microcoleus sp. FACHB-53]MBD2126190.1 hypothetical protein [Microcoleus sp. FACHB-1]